jgi:phospholipid transport system substrate-binding protein
MRANDKARFGAALAAAVTLLHSGAALAAPKEPELRARAEASAQQSAALAAMQGTIDEVLKVLRTPGVDEQGRRSQIETIAKTRFDFATMSKLVLKRDWKRFTPPEQKEFVAEFTEYLSASYGTRIARYANEDVVTLGARVEVNNDVTVQTAIKGGQFDGATVDYRMRLIAEKWQAIDVVIEGISLVSNFRSQFAEVIAKGGPQELLKRIKAKNEAGIVDAPPTSATGAK